MAALDPHDIAASLAGEFRIVPPALASTIAAHVGADLGVHAPEHIAQAVASDLGVEPPAPGVPGQSLVAQKDRNRFDTEAMASQPVGKHIAMSVAKDLGIDFGEAAPGPAGYGEEMARRALEETGRTGRAPLGMFAPGGMPEAGATLSDQEKQQKIAAGEMPQPATKEEAALQAGQTIQQMHGTGGFGGGGGIAAAGALGLGGIRGPRPVMAPEGKSGGGKSGEIFTPGEATTPELQQRLRTMHAQATEVVRSSIGMPIEQIAKRVQQQVGFGEHEALAVVQNILNKVTERLKSAPPSRITAPPEDLSGAQRAMGVLHQELGPMVRELDSRARVQPAGVTASETAPETLRAKTLKAVGVPPKNYSRDAPPPKTASLPDAAALRRPEADWHARVADLDARNAPDEAYRNILSAGAKETRANGAPRDAPSWRDKIVGHLNKAAGSEIPKVSAAEPAAPKGERPIHALRFRDELFYDPAKPGSHLAAMEAVRKKHGNTDAVNAELENLGVNDVGFIKNGKFTTVDERFGKKTAESAARPTEPPVQSRAIVPPAGAQPPARVPPPGGAPRTLGNLARRTFVSDTVDRYAAEAGASIRRETGYAARETEQARAAIEPFHRTVNALDEPGKQSVIDYIEDPGAPRARALPRDQQAFADTFRSIVQSRRAQLENMASTADMSFVDNYYTHNWTDPAQAQRVVNEWRGAAKEGSGRNLRERTVPTVAEGIRRGLVPKYGPIGTLLHYVDNMDRFIATNTIFDKAKDAGLVRYIPEGRPIPEGYAPVKGRLGNRGGQQAIAPDGWARVYNQHVSRGIYDTSPEIGEVYDKLRRGSNVLTQIKLGLSGYHWLTEAQTAINDSWAGAMDSLFAGHPGQAAARLAKGVVSPVRFATKGKRLEAVYLNKVPGTPQQRQIMNIITEAGGRGTATRHAPDYEMSRLGSYVTAFKRGALKAELAADKADVRANPAMGALRVGARHIGRIMSTIAQPLFEKYIPRIKNAAAAEHLEAWIERNPNATHEEQVAAARGIVDYVDDRYGEMIQDNIFMDKLVKQGATLALLSWSYRFGGIVRGIGKGLADTAVAPWRGGRLLLGAGPPQGPVPQGVGGLRGKQFWTPQMSYIIGIALTNAAIAAIYQGLKTGEAPKDMRDLVAPRTGGKDQKGRPERLMLPGHIKDVYGLAAHPAKEVTGGSSPWIPFTTQSLSLLWGEGGQDWQGKPIISHSKAGHPWLSNVPTWLKQYFGFAAQSLVPISASGLMRDNAKSGLNTVERVLGVRTAPSAIQTGKEYDPGVPKSRSQAVHKKIEEIVQQRGQKGVPPALRYGPGSHR